MINIKFNTHYIVTKRSNDGEITVGETLILRYQKRKNDSYMADTLGEYVLFSPPRKDAKSFFGMPQLSSVRYFNSIDELNIALEGVEVIPDKKLATELVADLKAKMEKIIIDHEL